MFTNLKNPVRWIARENADKHIKISVQGILCDPMSTFLEQRLSLERYAQENYSPRLYTSSLTKRFSIERTAESKKVPTDAASGEGLLFPVEVVV